MAILLDQFVNKKTEIVEILNSVSILTENSLGRSIFSIFKI
jgi:hypothetical protein